jgi:pyrroloquinoline quinone biosynthesis protein D
MTDGNTYPKLAKGVRLQADRVRGGFNLLAPERVLRTNVSSAAVLQLCDGKRCVDEIADLLAREFKGDRDRISRDVVVLLTELASRRMIEL